MPAAAYVRVCWGSSKKGSVAWATPNSSPQGGQRAGRLQSGTSFSHLHSRCAGLLFLCPNSLWECFCCGNSISSLPSLRHNALSSVGALPSLILLLLYNTSLFVNTSKYLEAVCRRSQKRSDVSGGRRTIQTQKNLRLEVDIGFLTYFLEQILSAQGFKYEHRETTQTGL